FRMRSVLVLLALVAVVLSATIPEPAPVQTGKAKVSDGLMCNACKDIVDDVENNKEDEIEDQLIASIHKTCSNLGHLAGLCEREFDKVMHDVVAYINNNYSPDQICQMTDFC
ncbi:hypothetical protein PFISCL1PPCAC_1234, partial [Pristionchus fissidentatus]